MKKTIYSLMILTAVLTSCSSEPITVTEGESFVFDGIDITANITAASVMSNDEKKTTIIAPEGKIYVKLNAEAAEDAYFMTLKNGDEDVEVVDYLTAMNFVDRSDDMMDPNKSDLYLLDLNNTGYTVEFKSYVDDIATLSVGQLVDEGSIKINSSMLEFVASFKDGARLSEIVTNYIPEGASVYDYITEKGMDVPADPMVSNLEINYIADENTYECSDDFGVDHMTVTWSNDGIEKVVFD
ncbi:MAG: hypothetical protein GQ574_29065 [Crocinitomix sp.]|nr:hypothetical protein [Crocinitomix sp.]